MIRLFRVLVPTSVAALLLSEIVLVLACYTAASLVTPGIATHVYFIDEANHWKILLVSAVIIFGILLPGSLCGIPDPITHPAGSGSLPFRRRGAAANGGAGLREQGLPAAARPDGSGQFRRDSVRAGVAHRLLEICHPGAAPRACAAARQFEHSRRNGAAYSQAPALGLSRCWLPQ